MAWSEAMREALNFAVIDFDIPFSDRAWREALKSEFERSDYQRMVSFLRSETERGAIIYPPKDLIFNAFNLTPLSKVKVVILGQDPYHGPGQAMGLSFSVPAGAKAPPSLKNIFAEVQNNTGGELRTLGALDDWAEQGVLLLNTVLTVEKGIAASHAKKGWEAFTDGAIRQLSAQRRGIVYLLWGSHAQKKISLINSRDNRVLIAPHPSPLSAYRGFLGCKHFSKANQYLEECGDEPICWAGKPTAQ